MANEQLRLSTTWKHTLTIQLMVNPTLKWGGLLAFPQGCQDSKPSIPKKCQRNTKKIAEPGKKSSSKRHWKTIGKTNCIKKQDI